MWAATRWHPQAFNTGVETYADLAQALAPSLLRLAVMLTGTVYDAEDLLQATFARSVRHGERIAGMAAPSAYLRRVMLNEHLSRGRARARRVRTAELVDVALPDASADVDARDETWRLLAVLPDKQRAVLVLRYYEDLPDAEIADLLGCPSSTVRSHAARGLAALRARMPEVQP